jgi:Cof subfamily protein (haloacid dehalogenase superfamily)
MTQNIKLVVVDLDGTLLNSKGTMSEGNEAALKKVIEQDVQVVIATGKTRISATPVIERLGLTTPGIYLQGLAIYQADGSISFQKTLEPEIARQVITFAEDRGYKLVAYSGNRILVREEHKRGKELAEIYGEPMPEAVGPLQNLLGEMPIHKLIAIWDDDPRKVKALRWQLDMQLAGKATLVQAMIPDMVEILPPKTSKGVALQSLLKQLSITASETLAIGDGENDIEMLKFAGVSVAIGNADERLKAIADHVVGTNDEDGVAEALKKFVIVEEDTEDSDASSDENDEVKSDDVTAEVAQPASEEDKSE